MSVWGTGIIKGLLISMRNMFRGPITVQYPRERVELPERARWAVEMKLDEEGQHKCTACMACERACPDYIIKIDVTTGEDKSKHIDAWNYEVGACMMCGLCVEACPFDAIKMGHDYELARENPDLLCVKLLDEVDAAKPKRKAAEPKPERPVGATGEGGQPREPAPAESTPDSEKPLPVEPASAEEAKTDD